MGRSRVALLLVAVLGCAPGEPPAAVDEAGPPAESAATHAAAPDPSSLEVDHALDGEMGLALAAMPLSCLDRPHALRPNRAGYLDDITYDRRRGFEQSRAFYGCWDWHSAVNSTWALARLVKEVPDLPVAPLILEKLRDHLSEAALEGELEYLANNPFFERSYGWAWLLLLHAELASWDRAEAATWAGRLDPLVRMVRTRLADHVADLDVPDRRGVHPNTAFSMSMSLDAARKTSSLRLEQTLETSAIRLFSRDRACPTAYEPARSDFVSPCLEEAALMARILEPERFAEWLDGFLPDPDSEAFAPLRNPATAVEDDPEPTEGGADITDDSLRAALGARSHLIGLAFTRAEAMREIAASLPDGDPRVPRFHDLAEAHAAAGFDTMFDADYAGSHWIGSFALKYLVHTKELNR